MLTNYATQNYLTQPNLLEDQVISHIIMPSVTKDSAKRLSTEVVQSHFSSPVRVQVSQEYNKTGRTSKRDSDLRAFAQVSAAPHTFVQRIHRAPGSSQPSNVF